MTCSHNNNDNGVLCGLQQRRRRAPWHSWQQYRASSPAATATTRTSDGSSSSNNNNSKNSDDNKSSPHNDDNGILFSGRGNHNNDDNDDNDTTTQQLTWQRTRDHPFLNTMQFPTSPKILSFCFVKCIMISSTFRGNSLMPPSSCSAPTIQSFEFAVRFIDSKQRGPHGSTELGCGQWE